MASSSSSVTVHIVTDSAHVQATCRTIAHHLTALADDLHRLDQQHTTEASVDVDGDPVTVPQAQA